MLLLPDSYTKHQLRLISKSRLTIDINEFVEETYWLYFQALREIFKTNLLGKIISESNSSFPNAQMPVQST